LRAEGFCPPAQPADQPTLPPPPPRPARSAPPPPDHTADDKLRKAFHTLEAKGVSPKPTAFPETMPEDAGEAEKWLDVLSNGTYQVGRSRGTFTAGGWGCESMRRLPRPLLSLAPAARPQALPLPRTPPTPPTHPPHLNPPPPRAAATCAS
jgi:hypothetical protein